MKLDPEVLKLTIELKQLAGELAQMASDQRTEESHFENHVARIGWRLHAIEGAIGSPRARVETND